MSTLSRRCAVVCLTVAAVNLLACPLGWAQGLSGVLTYHNDIGRTGQNLNETILTPQNVNMSNFGKLFAYPTDGVVFAQPLYVPNVAIPGQGNHNVLYVVTEEDGVYAFDADGKSSTPLWYVSLINPAQGITAVPCASMAQSCNVYPVDGITGTPVIDITSDTMYFVAQTLENGVAYQRLHAVDITTGGEKFGGPTIIQGSVKSSRGTVVFDPGHNLPRPGLLLLNNKVYMAWAGSTHGWMMSYDATTLQQIAIICTTPNGTLGGLWQSGGGIVSDGTYLYIETGDGSFDLDSGGKDFADSVVKLDPDTLAVLDYFTPMDQSCRRINDIDLGSGGAMLLPPQPGPFANEIVVSGKGGNPCDSFGDPPVWNSLVYLVNKDNLGHYNSLGPDPDIQTIEGAPYGYHSNPAYWQGPTASYIYLAGFTSEAGTGDFLKQYTLSNGLLSTAPAAQSTTNFVIGASPSISANGSTNGILWAQERQNILSSISNIQPSILYAFDATNVGTTLYSSSQAGSRDQAGSATKFQVPTIANGRVYLATLFELDVYGLLTGQSATTTTLSSNLNPVYGSPVTLKATVTSIAGPPSGSVNFYQKNGYNLQGVGTLVNKQTSIQVSGLSVGPHTFNASYDGTGAFAVSSGTITFSVNKAPTSTVINSSSLNPSTFGQPVTFTATVTSSTGAGTPTGTVTFEQAPGTVLGTGTLSSSGVATFTTTATQLNGGTDKILAIYSPDQNHAKSTSPTFSQVVNPEATSTAFTSLPNPSTVGQSVTLTATVTAAVGTPTGNVTFRANGALLGTAALVNGKATLNYSFPAKGSITVKAAFQGSANYALSSNSLTQVVN